MYPVLTQSGLPNNAVWLKLCDTPLRKKRKSVGYYYRCITLKARIRLRSIVLAQPGPLVLMRYMIACFNLVGTLLLLCHYRWPFGPPGPALARARPGLFFIGPCLAWSNIPPGRAVLARGLSRRPKHGPAGLFRAGPARQSSALQQSLGRPKPIRGEEAAATAGAAETRRRRGSAWPRRGGGGGRRGGDEAAAPAGIWWMRQSPGSGGVACPHSRTR
jgi:hypothetical protein